MSELRRMWGPALPGEFVQISPARLVLFEPALILRLCKIAGHATIAVAARLAASTVFTGPITADASHRSVVLWSRPESQFALVEHLPDPRDAVPDVVDEWLDTKHPFPLAASTDATVGVLMMGEDRTPVQVPAFPCRPRADVRCHVKPAWVAGEMRPLDQGNL